MSQEFILFTTTSFRTADIYNVYGINIMKDFVLTNFWFNSTIVLISQWHTSVLTSVHRSTLKIKFKKLHFISTNCHIGE